MALKKSCNARTVGSSLDAKYGEACTQEGVQPTVVVARVQALSSFQTPGHGSSHNSTLLWANASESLRYITS